MYIQYPKENVGDTLAHRAKTELDMTNYKTM